MASRRKATVYRQTLDDGLGRKFTVEVPVIATEYWDEEDQQWLECLDSDACAAIDAEIEKAYPGWFHTCRFDGEKTTGKETCKACKRSKHRLTG